MMSLFSLLFFLLKLIPPIYSVVPIETRHLYPYGDWHNPTQTNPILEFFNHNDGLISVMYDFDIRTRIPSKRWDFVFTLYDGDYVDMKYAQAFIHVENSDTDLITDYEKAAFTIPNITLNITYGEADQKAFHQQCLGNFSLAFKDPSTNLPLIDDNTDYPQDFALQVSFRSLQCSLSFDTSILRRGYPMANIDALASWVVGLVGFFCVAYLETLGIFSVEGSKVSLGSVILMISGDIYVITVCFSKPELWGSVNTFFLGVTAIFLLMKVFAQTVKKAYSVYEDNATWKKWTLFFFLIITGVTIGCLPYIIASIWMKLFPGLILFPQILQKIENIDDHKACFRYEIIHLLFLSFWMAYTYLYPGNAFKISPQPLLVGTFLVLVFLQIVLLVIRIKHDSRNREGDEIIRKVREGNELLI